MAKPASCFSFAAQTYKTGAMPSVGEIARAVRAKVIGDEHAAITGVASIVSASKGDLVFVEDEKHLDEALNSAATAVIAGSFAEGIATSKTLLVAANPRLAFARAASKFPTLSHKTREGWGNRPTRIKVSTNEGFIKAPLCCPQLPLPRRPLSIRAHTSVKTLALATTLGSAQGA